MHAVVLLKLQSFLHIDDLSGIISLLEKEVLVPVGRPTLVLGVPTSTASPVLNACHVSTG